MSNLVKKSLFESTIFQYGMILNSLATIIYYNDGLTGEQLIGWFAITFAGYVAKEGVAKSAEAYRDKK